MKTLTISLSLIFMCQISLVQSKNPEEDEKGKKTKTEAPKDTLENDLDMEFNVIFEQNEVKVFVNGKFDPYASVSINSSRGSDVLFKFIQSGSNQLSFDISTLDKGSYFVLLNSNKEIRIKRFFVD